jgi:hypothetical protein
MTITIAPELESQLLEKAQAEGLTVEAYVGRLIRDEEDWQERFEAPLSESGPEFAEIRTAVQAGLEQAEGAEARPAVEVFAELRAKHGISG